MNSRQFGERVAFLRKSRSMTQAQLAEKLNVSNKTISRWETGDGYPEITLLMPLAKTLGVTVDELLEDDDSVNGDDVNPQESAEDNTFGSSAASKGKKEFFNFTEKEYKHKDIPVAWPVLKIKSLCGTSGTIRNFWHSLIIFNKLAVGCLILDLLCIIIGFILMICFNAIMATPILMMMPSFISRAGVIIGLIGLVLGLFDIYDRQNKASIILIITNLVSIYVFPLLFMLFSATGLMI